MIETAITAISSAIMCRNYFTSTTCRYDIHSIVRCSTIKYSAALCNKARYSTVQYSTVQYSTVQYSTVLYSTVYHACCSS